MDPLGQSQVREQFRGIVYAAPYAMIVVDDRGRITLANEQATLMFGYDESEMLGREIEMLMPEPARGQHARLRSAFMTDPSIRPMGAGREFVAMKKDGSHVEVEVGLNPLRMEDGLRVLASITDITERKAREALRVKKEAAEAAYRAKGELLAVASHDLKNPLSAISGLADVLLETKQADPDASPEDVEVLRRIHDASRHMSEVVAGILSNERIEQQGIAFDDERVDASALCADVLRIADNVARRKNIALVGNIEPGVAVRGNATRLREAFDNYVSNAIKYSPAGKTVTVTLATDGGQVELGVRDEGPGLTDEDKTRLFGKFAKLSAKPTGGESSTGLGLSIVKAVIELHRGTVGCESREREGAYFWARLPKA